MKKAAVASLAVLVLGLVLALIGSSVYVYYLSDSYSKRVGEDYGFDAGFTIKHVRKFVEDSDIDEKLERLVNASTRDVDEKHVPGYLAFAERFVARVKFWDSVFTIGLLISLPAAFTLLGLFFIWAFKYVFTKEKTIENDREDYF